MTRTDPLATRTDPAAISIDFKDTVNVYVCVYSETAQTQVVGDYPVSRLLFYYACLYEFYFCASFRYHLGTVFMYIQDWYHSAQCTHALCIRIILFTDVMC